MERDTCRRGATVARRARPMGARGTTLAERLTKYQGGRGVRETLRSGRAKVTVGLHPPRALAARFSGGGGSSQRKCNWITRLGETARENQRQNSVSCARVRAGDLQPNPKNWREHPKAQREALQGLLAEIGYADALLARELPDGGAVG